MRLSKIWKNRSQILEGIKNNTFKKDHIEAIHDERMKICQGCDKLDTEGSKCEVKGTQPCCGDCGCSLKFKLRSLSSSCPIGKWKSFINEEDEYLVDELNNQDNE